MLKGNGAASIIAYDTPISVLDQWYHIAITRNGDAGYMEFYIDGVLQKRDDGYSKTSMNIERIFIGNDQDSLGGDFALNNQFFGSFSELRIYDMVKSSMEIESIYNEICNLNK